MADNFKSLGVRADLVQGLDGLGIQTPTPVQNAVIPFLLNEGSDLIAQAQTGTGKTAAFGVPLLMKVDPSIDKIQGLIIAPTRELAKQIGKELFRFTKFCDPKIFIEVAAGGDKLADQIQRLSRPTPILVATPGRLMDLLKEGLQLDGVQYLVLDEADEMLSMGFQQELASIFKETPKRQATWLFSATFQKRVQGLISDHMSAQAHRVQVDPKQVVNRNIDHQYAICAREEKDAFIIHYLKGQGSQRGLIFCRTRAGAIRMGEELEKAGLSVGVIQGDLSQRDRDKVMRAFKKERVQFLIATDVAARGIDVEALSFVIQHQLPDAIQYYTHRSGRTARAGKRGVSLTLIEPSERGQITKLEQSLGLNFSLVE
ncbi:DEAD/DEAH box helicase [Coraliomargarita sp. SDUM461003]|uniref:DEAD/DEAH box helicase n=1 Tax=Thalassobacterium maritimum TaxID=3041265 RepID=A0ABU1B0L3_9BACT|nr:DEAD/DEAH box helicase [Coraliomargarita sp. SDUM461003]MDQ8208807.1 DEAD/DEAH box helicase [Coraliomargarita sp. SDUM461003]